MSARVLFVFLSGAKPQHRVCFCPQKPIAAEGAEMTTIQTGVDRKMLRSKLLHAALAAAVLVAVVCTVACSSVQGTYTDTTDAVSLVLKSGGNATFTFAGQ